MQNHNQYIFRVRQDATKADVKARRRADVRSEGRARAGRERARQGAASASRQGRTQDWKKAYVSLAPGQTIDYEARPRRARG